MYIVSIMSKLEDFGKSINTFLDKFMSNPAMAGVVALVLFVVIFLAVNSFTRK